MRFALSLGAAFAVLTLAASAHTDHQRIFIRHAGGPVDFNVDADNDGWVTRAEASAAADRVFDQLDTNDDGQLNDEDRVALNDFDIRVDVPDIQMLAGGDDEADDDDDDGDHARGVVVLQDDHGHRTVRILRRGERLDDETRAEIERAVAQAQRAAEQAERVADEAQRQADRAQRDADRATEQAERQAERVERQAEREAEQAEREAERAAERAERHVERNVIIVRGHGGGHWASGDGVIAPVPPIPPVPAVPGVPAMPMFMMLIANSDEADLNGDGALSRDEFRAQQLRFFDASDANGDRRVRFEPPPVPPIPPTPPIAVAPAAPAAPATPTAPAPPAPPRHR